MSKEKLQDQNETIAGAASVVKIGDRTFIGSEPDATAFMTLQRYARKRLPSPLSLLARDPGFHELTKAQQDAYLQKVAEISAGGGATLTTQAVIDAVDTVEGVRLFAWAVVRKHQPDVTLEELATLITDANHPVVFADLLRAAGWVEGPLGNSPGPA